MCAENIGLLLWGGVGTGKSFLAGCIANALMAQEVPVRMTNFAHILNEIRHPQDTAHARIYDRLLEMCVPISCIGVSLRRETAQEKLERLKALIGWIGKKA